MPLRGIAEMGGARKQNGHLQSSSYTSKLRRFGDDDDGWKNKYHWQVVYKNDDPGAIFNKDEWLSPVIFGNYPETTRCNLKDGASKTYTVEFRSEIPYKYSDTMDILAGVRWSGYLTNIYIGRDGDFYLFDGDRKWCKVAWSIYPDRFKFPGWISTYEDRDAAYQFKTGETGYFLNWLAYGGIENYYSDDDPENIGKLYLWEVNPIDIDNVNTVGVRYLGINMTVESGWDIISDWNNKKLFGGTATNGDIAIPFTEDTHCLNGKFYITINNESGEDQKLKFMPWSEVKQQPISGSLIHSVFRNSQDNPAYVKVLKGRR